MNTAAVSENMTDPVVCLQVSDHPESGPPTPAPTAGIVGALMEVMQKRSKAIHSSGDWPAARQLPAAAVNFGDTHCCRLYGDIDRYSNLYLCVCVMDLVSMEPDCPYWLAVLQLRLAGGTWFHYKSHTKSTVLRDGSGGGGDV